MATPNWKSEMGLEFNRPDAHGIIINGADGTWTPVGGTMKEEYTVQEIQELDKQAAQAHKEYLAETLKHEIARKKHLNGWIEVHTDKANHFKEGKIVYVGRDMAKVEAVYDNIMLVRPLNKLETLTAHTNRVAKWIKYFFVKR